MTSPFDRTTLKILFINLKLEVFRHINEIVTRL